MKYIKLMCLTMNVLCFWLDMRAFDELRKLEIFFKEENKCSCSIIELYELIVKSIQLLRSDIYCLDNS